MPALPALLGRGTHLAGASGFWVGHSSERFTVELMSDREPGLRARLPGIHPAGAEIRADARVSLCGMRKRTLFPHWPTFHAPLSSAQALGRFLLFTPVNSPTHAGLSCRGVRQCP